jgi:hypothetical protein
MANNTTAEINFNPATVAARIKGNSTRAQKWLDNEVLKDCTPYVPRITGALEHSGIDGTTIGEGLIQYNSPYAKRQYYGYFNHSTQSHPQACRMWFEVAKAAHKNTWLAGAKALGGGG